MSIIRWLENRPSACRHNKIPIPDSLHLCSNSVQSLRHLGLSKCLCEFCKGAFLCYKSNVNILIDTSRQGFRRYSGRFDVDSLFWMRHALPLNLRITIVSRNGGSFLCHIYLKDLHVQKTPSIINRIVQEVSQWHIWIDMTNCIVPAPSHRILFSSPKADRPSSCSWISSRVAGSW